jgi:cell division septum initiation protein DivIVA
VRGFDKRGVTFARPVKRGPRGPRLPGPATRGFPTFDPTEPNGDFEGELEYPVDDEPVSPWDQHATRFPIARNGYDCAFVDEHVAGLERDLTEMDRELAELRARTPSGNEVAAEIQRIGEQTSTILLEAHDKAHETTRDAQAQADRCIADAASNAIAITEDANRQLRQLEGDMTSLRHERERLLEDIRNLASALSSVAEQAADRFPADRENELLHAKAAPEPTDEDTSEREHFDAEAT